MNTPSDNDGAPAPVGEVVEETRRGWTHEWLILGERHRAYLRRAADRDPSGSPSAVVQRLIDEAISAERRRGVIREGKGAR